MENPELAKIVHSLNVALFAYKSGDCKRDAQINLNGRTCYCDADTLKWHKSRIVAGNDSSSGLIYWIIESVAVNYENTKRGFRAVAFDVFGTVIYRVDLENTFKTSDKARKEFYVWLNGFSLLDHYRNALAMRASAAKREHDQLREAYNATFGSAE
jgi:hypothetical protein